MAAPAALRSQSERLELPELEAGGTLGQNNLLVLFGAEPPSATTTGSEFQGRLDDVRLWSSARATGRIRDSHTRRVSGDEPHRPTGRSFKSVQ